MIDPNVSLSWAMRLGLSPYPLFGFDKPPLAGDHYALLDGVKGSFLISSEIINGADIGDGPNWAWSSNLRQHVTVTDDKVVVKYVVPVGKVEVFSRESVENKLDKFFTFLKLYELLPEYNVIEHIIDAFRGHRHSLGGDPAIALESFLILLAGLIDKQIDDPSYLLKRAPEIAEEYGLRPEALDFKIITEDYLNRFLEQILFNKRLQKKLNLKLTIRHAGGALFQETYSDLHNVQLSLFRLPEAKTHFINLGIGAYYTPPSIARSIAELALLPHLGEPSIIIGDPACGSGIFLCEALRTLQRLEYKGQIRLVGMDYSPSAVKMARFAIACAQKDWPGKIIYSEIIEGDFLTDKLPIDECHVIIMNPPFQSWQSMEAPMRDKVKNILGDLHIGRPDLSMVFVQKAIEILRIGGTLGSILPIGVLSSESSRNWRNSLLERSTVTFLSVL